MNWTHVSSSHISSIAYDDKSASLYVRFHDGATYIYYDVPVFIYDGLLSAASHGSYLASRVKGVFRYKRL
ncbi:KTSC domain-containing protein [Paenibacillus hunanensis]|uniref:KTSC domain-containing protein n=1 Tax=Paenibacillus hunanensis TaxID=539262 RepID=A0ABU1ITY2_9BACL|nr:KTSC domain-containing protein [Paenibacillus hunanensis]MDR6242683.1 hypothetical protein [Paenibacillus hunanensis]GGJ01876.1 hypothetical protein GCM10008022_08580 [Paenibacillus hunanensis]